MVDALAGRCAHRGTTTSEGVIYVWVVEGVRSASIEGLVGAGRLVAVGFQITLRRCLVQDLLALSSPKWYLVRLLSVQGAHLVESLRSAQIIVAGVIKCMRLLIFRDN